MDISEGIADASEGRSYSVTVNEAREARQEATTAKARHKAEQQEKMRQATLQARCERIKGAFRGESNLTSSKLKSKSGLSGSPLVKRLPTWFGLVNWKLAPRQSKALKGMFTP